MFHVQYLSHGWQPYNALSWGRIGAEILEEKTRQNKMLPNYGKGLQNKN